jgi:hypothetical protein
MQNVAYKPVYIAAVTERALFRYKSWGLSLQKWGATVIGALQADQGLRNGLFGIK